MTTLCVVQIQYVDDVFELTRKTSLLSNGRSIFPILVNPWRK